MSSAPSDKAPPRPFDVFRSDGASRLPGQRFPKSEPVDPAQRSGPIEQRVINDTTDVPAKGDIERGQTVLRRGDEHGHQEEKTECEPMTIRLDTYSVDLAARIARVKAEQQEALDNLQRLEGDNRDQQSD